MRNKLNQTKKTIIAVISCLISCSIHGRVSVKRDGKTHEITEGTWEIDVDGQLRRVDEH